MSLTSKNREVRIGQRTVDVHEEAPECAECGEVFYSPSAVDSLQMRAAEAVRTREGLLQPSAIRRIRETIGASQADFERLLGVGPKTVVRWEKGTVFQNSATDSLLRVLAAVPDAVQYLAQIRGVSVKSHTKTFARGESAQRTGKRRFHYAEPSKVVSLADYIGEATAASSPAAAAHVDLLQEAIA